MNPELDIADGRNRDLTFARLMLGIVAAGLLASGITCYFLKWEVSTTLDIVWNRTPDRIPLMEGEYELFVKVEKGLVDIGRNFPEFFLGTDWLGFAHIVLAILFIGAIRDPVRNVWIVQFGMISAVMVVIAAFIFGHMRGLPPIHYFVDASFGFCAFIPLYLAYRRIKLIDCTS